MLTLCRVVVLVPPCSAVINTIIDQAEGRRFDLGSSPVSRCLARKLTARGEWACFWGSGAGHETRFDPRGGHFSCTARRYEFLLLRMSFVNSNIRDGVPLDCLLTIGQLRMFNSGHHRIRIFACSAITTCGVSWFSKSLERVVLGWLVCLSALATVNASGAFN